MLRENRFIWLYQSQLASVQDVQRFGRAYPNPAVYFLSCRGHRLGLHNRGRPARGLRPMPLRKVASLFRRTVLCGKITG